MDVQGINRFLVSGLAVALLFCVAQTKSGLISLFSSSPRQLYSIDTSTTKWVQALFIVNYGYF